MIDLLAAGRALGYAAVAAGILLFAVAALGLLRLPDVYTRLSAVTKAATLGVCLVLLGALLIEPSWRTAIPLLLAVALQLITSPVGGFALGRAAYRAGVSLNTRAHYNDLARDEALPEEALPEPRASDTEHHFPDDTGNHPTRRPPQ
ncbi:multicomponent Na+:H+ antiporter subunit G [Microbacterium sp. AK009]|uniref:monovalent cation/H(+) antiporter subunit G n=1 Tax=Microbacterium sp. AK009 TaxID=2723068 RepID=UPI0015CAB42B|nr:monovalent cation/H(+) antiporter subunit G [Microbacterium sp. AK009]NYF16586.1 multicomponent Na+:H+ antiporter subunit G [Microbacterium sp. AK009]